MMQRKNVMKFVLSVALALAAGGVGGGADLDPGSDRRHGV